MLDFGFRKDRNDSTESVDHTEVTSASARGSASSAAEQMLDAALDAVVRIDANNCVTYMNPAAETLWGVNASDVIGQNVKMLVPSEHRAGHDGYVNRHRQTAENRIVGSSREVEIERPDGTRRWVSLALSKVEEAGKPHGYAAFVRDVTEDRERREIINQTLEQALDAVVTIDDNNIVTFMNAAAEKLWGYDRTEVLGQNVKMLVPQVHQSRHDDYVNANRNTGQDKIVGSAREVELHRKDGEVLTVQLSLSRVKLNNKTLYTAFLRDVTAEVAQREQVKVLSLVANETDNSVIITDADGRIEYINPGFTKLTGYGFEEVQGKKPGDFLQGKDTDPETVRTISASLQRGEAFYEEILNYTKAGEPYWISLAVNPVRNEAGKTVRYISIQANISDVKAESIEFETRLKAISETAAIAEWTSLHNTGEYNDYLASRTRSFNTLGAILDADDISALGQGELVRREIVLEGAGEEELALDAVFSSVRDVNGEVTKYLMFGVDVTNRRQALTSADAAMEKVIASGEDIAQFVAEIDTIAKQTNLLSLNATIEASRAGEAGRGFAVVATEVRDLSQRAAQTAAKISDVVGGNDAQVKELSASLQKLVG